MIWIAKPDEVEKQVLKWVQSRSPFLSIETLTQFTGRKVYALTVTDGSRSNDSKVRMIVTVPHAHEPAGTAACINVINQLIVGQNLEDENTDIDRKAALSRLILIFIPDANPEGRERSPEKLWDGTKYTNEEFLNTAFGIGKDGKRFHRYGRWCSLEHSPRTIGIIYEKTWNHIYVEPNKDWSSSYYRFLIRLLPQHKYNLILDLHQTEFEKQPYNAEVILPTLQNELYEDMRIYNASWGQYIVKALKAAGANPKPKPKPPPYIPLGYLKEHREYFVKYQGFVMRSTPSLMIEIQNNNLRTPPYLQLRFHEAAIKATIKKLLEDNAKPPSRLLKGL